MCIVGHQRQIHIVECVLERKSPPETVVTRIVDPAERIGRCTERLWLHLMVSGEQLYWRVELVILSLRHPLSKQLRVSPVDGVREARLLPRLQFLASQMNSSTM
ncbi:hypothetical protein E0I56_005695 [Escherichia coli]|nr:hypothetical protein [Escherichia coli]